MNTCSALVDKDLIVNEFGLNGTDTYLLSFAEENTNIYIGFTSNKTIIVSGGNINVMGGLLNKQTLTDGVITLSNVTITAYKSTDGGSTYSRLVKTIIVNINVKVEPIGVDTQILGANITDLNDLTNVANIEDIASYFGITDNYILSYVSSSNEQISTTDIEVTSDTNITVGGSSTAIYDNLQTKSTNTLNNGDVINLPIRAYVYYTTDEGSTYIMAGYVVINLNIAYSIS